MKMYFSFFKKRYTTTAATDVVLKFLSVNPKNSFCKKKTPEQSSQPVSQHKARYDEWIFSITTQRSMVRNRKAERGSQDCYDHQNPHPSIVIIKNIHQFYSYLKEYKWNYKQADESHISGMPDNEVLLTGVLK